MCVFPQCYPRRQVVTLEQWGCVRMPVHLCCSAFPPNHDSHPLLQHLMLFLSQVEEDLPFLISVSISRALSHGFSPNSLQLMRLPLYNSCSRRAGFISTTSFSWILSAFSEWSVPKECVTSACLDGPTLWTHTGPTYGQTKFRSSSWYTAHTF